MSRFTLSIRNQILIASGLLLACMAICSVAVVVLGGELGQVSLELYDKSFVSSRYAQKVQTDFVRLEGHHTDADIPLTSDDDKAAVADMLTEIDVVTERAATKKEKAVTATVRTDVQRLVQPADGAAYPSLASIDKTIGRMSQRFADDALDHREKTEQLVQNLRQVLLAVAIASVVGVSCFALFLIRAVVMPLRQVSRVISTGAEDRFDPPPALARRHDEIGKIVSALHDRHQATEALKQLRIQQAEAEAAVKAAEMANAAKSDFLSVMSHEIRTPMNGVLGMVQAMQGDPLSDLQRERLDVIRGSGETLLAILNDILDLSKIEAGKLELEETDFDLAQLGLDVFSAFRSDAEAKGLKFTLETAPSAHAVFRGDAIRVRQILYNLVSNAVKFTGAGSVSIYLGRSDADVVLSIRDTGVGMQPEQVSRLFEKFTQADSSTTRQFGGSGLGLSICKRLCEAMGGEVSVESEFGRGSHFEVKLPLSFIGEAGVAAPAAAHEAPEFEARALRILVAEDNPTNQLVLKTLLGQVGLEPVMAPDGVHAVSAWEAEHWDLILMDVQMPAMDGPTATQHIRRREAETGRAAVPIIALTANAMKHQIEGYFAAGMTAFVSKPIVVADLFAAMEAALAETSAPSPLAGEGGREAVG